MERIFKEKCKKGSWKGKESSKKHIQFKGEDVRSNPFEKEKGWWESWKAS